LAGTPSTAFDAIALVLSDTAGAALAKESCAVDWVRDAFGHLKAICHDVGAQAVIDAAGIKPDAGVVAADDSRAFVEAARTRQFAREPSIRTLP
jgi:catalase